MITERRQVATILWGATISGGYLLLQRLSFYLNEGLADTMTVGMPLAGMASAFLFARGLGDQQRRWLTGILLGFAVGTLLKEFNWILVIDVIVELRFSAKLANLQPYGAVYGLISIATVILSCLGGLAGSLFRRKPHTAAQEK